MGVEKSEKVISKILDLIQEGKSLVEICNRKDMPHRSNFMRWLQKDEQLRDKYIEAKERCMDFYADEIIQIADNIQGNPVLDEERKPLIDKDGNIVRILDAPRVSEASLKIKSRQWLMGKLKRKKYGEHRELEVKGEVNVLHGLSDKELSEKLVELTEMLIDEE